MEFAVAGLPEFKREATVSMDGEVALPVVGQVKAEGLTLNELRINVQALVAGRSFRNLSATDPDRMIVLDKGEITIEIIRYRPIHIDGDISKPGEYGYSAGLTVRKAVALAGGYDVLRYKMDNPVIETSTLRADYEANWAEIDREHARIWRLQSEIGVSNDVYGVRDADRSIPRHALELQSEIKSIRAVELDRERHFLQDALRKADDRTVLLDKQRKQEQEGAEADVSEFNRTKELFDRGTLPTTRVTDARRSVLLSSTRNLQTLVQISQIDKERGDLALRLDGIDDQRRLQILGEIEESKLKIATLRAKISSLDEKLVYTGAIRTMLLQGTGPKPNILLFRKTGERTERIVGQEDDQLYPGDVIEVRIAFPAPTKPPETSIAPLETSPSAVPRPMVEPQPSAVQEGAAGGGVSERPAAGKPKQPKPRGTN